MSVPYYKYTNLRPKTFFNSAKILVSKTDFIPWPSDTIYEIDLD